MSDGRGDKSITNGGAALAVDVGQFPARLVQSIYHHLTAKTERITEVFSGAYVIDYDSLTALHNKVSQTAERFHNGEYSCEIYHSLKNAESLRHTDFARFQYYDRTNPAPTRAVVYTFDFMSIVDSKLKGDAPKPERYIVEVKIDQDVELDDDDDNRPSFITRIIAGRNIAVKIEHVDYVVGRALITAVREWVSALPKKEESFITQKIVKSSRSIENLLPLFSSATFLGLFYFYYFKSIIFDDKISSYVDLMVLALVFSIIILSISKYAVKKSVDASFELQQRSYILLTSGDKERCKLMKQSRSKRNGILFFGFSVVLIPIAVNLFVAFYLIQPLQ